MHGPRCKVREIFGRHSDCEAVIVIEVNRTLVGVCCSLLNVGYPVDIYEIPDPPSRALRAKQTCHLDFLQFEGATMRLWQR